MNDTFTYNNTSNTKLDTSLNCNMPMTNHQFNTRKVQNFLMALKEIKGENKISLKDNKVNINLIKSNSISNPLSNSNKSSSRNLQLVNNITTNLTTEYDKNINENSVTNNANNSLEENTMAGNVEVIGVAKLPYEPVEKMVEIVDNSIRIRKKKRSSQSAYSIRGAANFPYKMDIILKPFLKQEKIVEVDEDSEEDLKVGGKIINNLEVNNPGLINSKNKCSTAYGSNNGSLNKEKEENKKIRKITCEQEKLIITMPIPPTTNNKNANLDDLDDLDEVKEINLNDYQFDGKSSGIGRRLNISDLDLIGNHKKYKGGYNKNSKILIVDSVSNSGEIYFNNNRSYGENHSNKLHTYNNNEFSLSPHIHNFNFNFLSNKYQASGESGLINTLNKISTLNNPLNSTQKKMRRKYFKSEIFESYNKDKGWYEKNFGKSQNVCGGNTRKRGNTVNNICEVKEKVNKNLLKKFEEVGLEKEENIMINNNNSVEIEIKSELEGEVEYQLNDLQSFNVTPLEMEKIDLATEYENTSILVNPHNENDMYKTPESRVRNQNTINEYTGGKVPTKKEQNIFSFDNSFYSHNKSHSHSQSHLQESYVDTVFDLEFINNLLSKEHYYRANPDYLTSHPSLEIIFRTVLVEWLMELCEEFAFKRDTFHYAVNYLDRYLSKTKNMTKHTLQLVGVTCLSIAAKCEEIQIPKIEDYINSTDNCYSHEEFMLMEKQILKVLRWEIMPITINTWLNWYLCQWDLYIDTLPYIQEKLSANNRSPIYFKKADEHSYVYYRQITQLIDLYTVDYSSLTHIPRYLIAASLFITIGRVMKFEAFLPMNINKFDFDSDFYLSLLSQKDHYFIDIFSDFLQQSFNFSILDFNFIEAMVYVSKFLEFEFNYNLPLVIQGNEEGIENVSELI